jgi:hypothetical protein
MDEFPYGAACWEPGWSTNARLREQAGRAGLTSIRLPCGTGMNFWNWRTGLPHDRQRLEAAGCDFDHHFMQWVIKGRTTIPKHCGGPLTLDRWLSFVKDLKAAPIWGVNIVTGSEEETRWLAQELKRAQAPVLGFELGNETYLGGSRPGLKDVRAVLERCRLHASILQTECPQVPIAVPAKEVAMGLQAQRRLLGLEKGDVWPTPWNRALKNDPFFDAVTVHFYCEVSEAGDLNHTSQEQVASWAFARSSAASLRAIGNYYANEFPGKQVWLTEWGFDHDMWRRRAWRKMGKDAVKLGQRHLPEQSLLHGLFMADFLINLASVKSPITIATTHPLLNELGTGMIVTGAEPKTRITLDVFEMLSPAFHHCTSVRRVNVPTPHLTESERFPGLKIPGVDAVQFYDDEGPRYLAIVNKLPHPVRLRPPSEMTGSLSIETLTAEVLLPGWGAADNPPLRLWAPDRQRSKRTQVAEKPIELPKWSFSMVAVSR